MMMFLIADLTRLAFLAKKHAQSVVYIFGLLPLVLKVTSAVEERIDVVEILIIEDSDAG
jgi:hypothetical protein